MEKKLFRFCDLDKNIKTNIEIRAIDDTDINKRDSSLFSIDDYSIYLPDTNEKE